MKYCLEEKRRIVTLRERTQYYGDPGGIHVKRGETITFYSESSHISIFVPFNNVLVSEDGVNHRFWDIPLGESITLRVSEDVKPDIYPYSIFCHDAREFAVGNSS